MRTNMLHDKLSMKMRYGYYTRVIRVKISFVFAWARNTSLMDLTKSVPAFVSRDAAYPNERASGGLYSKTLLQYF